MLRLAPLVKLYRFCPARAESVSARLHHWSSQAWNAGLIVCSLMSQLSEGAAIADIRLPLAPGFSIFIGSVGQ